MIINTTIDDSNILKQIVDLGYSIRPYFSNSPEDFLARTFILDYDNLTEEQYRYIARIATERKIPFSESSGMKQQRYEWANLHPNEPFVPKNNKWKIKVFYPCYEHNTYYAT